MTHRRVGVIGSFVWDVIHGRDTTVDHLRHRTPIEEWGGITYALSAFDAALGPDWDLVPIVKVGEDLAPRARDYLRTLRHLAPDAAPVVVPYPNNRVTLVYRDAERRTETLAGGVPAWTWTGLAPLLHGLDALYVNLMSGWELDLDTFRLVRQHFRGPIYCDFHSLCLDHRDGGERTLQPLPNAIDWFRCVDFAQVNEDEMAMMAPDAMALSAMAMAAGVQVLAVTLGARGAVYFAAPSFGRLADLPAGRAHALAASPGPVRTALVPSVPTRVAQGGDPTGCGDVWGATFFSRLLDDDIMTNALHAAMVAAARNVEHRGATGLAHHLRGELSPT
ncbi:MAG TPA: PfkB family carbohydrate kinase [Gemmatimonadaceae bacterium]|nr:PfkB family carbohydrate kinase [Gemmatimonadaceae bacterium]